jgi:hypothetical protein
MQAAAIQRANLQIAIDLPLHGLFPAPDCWINGTTESAERFHDPVDNSTFIVHAVASKWPVKRP